MIDKNEIVKLMEVSKWKCSKEKRARVSVFGNDEEEEEEEEEGNKIKQVVVDRSFDVWWV